MCIMILNIINILDLKVPYRIKNVFKLHNKCLLRIRYIGGDAYEDKR